MDFKDFFLAFTNNWVSLLSGCGSVALLIIGLPLYKKGVPRWIVLLVAAICFFIASVKVWTTEHQAVIVAQQATNALQGQLDAMNKPDFILDAYQTVVVDQLAQKPSAFLVNLTLKNLGAASAAYIWNLSIKSPTMNIGPLQPTEIKDGYQLKKYDGTVVATFHKDNRMEEKTL
jgi:hypothetical protein